MHEFDEAEGRPPLSMDLPVKAFESVLNYMTRHSDGELALVDYQACLDETPDPEADGPATLTKQGLLYEHIGHIKVERGEYQEALDSYRTSRVIMEQVSEDASLPAATLEANVLFHELSDPVAAVEPYEFAKFIYEKRFADSNQPPSERTFEVYMNVLSHLAGAYQAAGEMEKLRELNLNIMALGGITPSMFGFDPCRDDEQLPDDHLLYGAEMKPLFMEIKQKLLDGPPEDQTPEAQILGLRSLELLVDRDDFMSDLPEQRDLILMLIYTKYGELVQDGWEGEEHLKKALAIAKNYQFVVPIAHIYLTIGENQAKRQRPLNEVVKTTRKAFAAAETCLDSNASVDTSRIELAANVLLMYLQARRDYVGIEKIKRRLAIRGLDVVRDVPSAAEPWLN